MFNPDKTRRMEVTADDSELLCLVQQALDNNDHQRVLALFVSVLAQRNQLLDNVGQSDSNKDVDFDDAAQKPEGTANLHDQKKLQSSVVECPVDSGASGGSQQREGRRFNLRPKKNVKSVESTVKGRRASSRHSHSCAVCGMTFSRQTWLTRHERSVHGVVTAVTCGDVSDVTCDVCGKVFASKQGLKVHSRLHTGERPCECEVCHRTFSQMSSLWVHMATHSTDKPHQCDLCGHAFKWAASLKKHKMYVHDKCKPFKCDHCPSAFSQPYDLQKHVRVHTGEKPYTCEICGVSFRQASNMIQHKKTVHDNVRPHECPVCSVRFAVKSQLRKHEKTHQNLAATIQGVPLAQSPSGETLSIQLWPQSVTSDNLMTT